MALVWENLSCDKEDTFYDRLLQQCRPAKKKKRILTDLNGCLEFGEMTALMGPSGAGKSTLLNCLIQGESYSGTHGRIAAASKTEIRSVLITQNERDHLLMNLTVFESLYYASELKNPYRTTELEHKEIVKQLLDELDLSKVENVTVLRCSGGQKKRIAIGLELTAIKKPNFLFLDEPTSGLDSHTGFKVVYRLRNLAQQLNIAVVTVIHQPSFEIFSQFHNVYILSCAGRCVFSGSPSELRQHLAHYKYENSNSNPADVIIFIASCASKEEEDEDDDSDIEADHGHKDTFKKVEETKRDCEEMTKREADNWTNNAFALSGVEIEEHGLCTADAKFELYSLWVLLKRTFITSLLRQKRLIFIRSTLHVVVAFVLAALYKRNIGKVDDCFVSGRDYSNCSCNTEDNLRNESIPTQNVKFQFFSLLFLMFAALMPTVLTFPGEIKLFINEHRNGWYSTSYYYISKTLMEIPFQLIFTIFYAYFLYWYSEQIDTRWRYGYFLTVTVLSCFIAQGFGFLIGVMCVNSFSMAIILSSTVLLFQFLFSGFFVRVINMSMYTKWITYFSFVRFSFESLLIILYGENRCKSPFKSSIMFTFNLHDDDLSTNLFWIIVHLIATRVMAFILLRQLADPESISTTFSWTIVSKSISLKYGKVRSHFGNSSNFKRQYDF